MAIVKDKCKKVYRVHTALSETDSEDEIMGWSHYNVIAVDTESAIKAAKALFHLQNEYVESVEFITKLD